VRDLAIEGRAADAAPFRGGYGASAVTFFFVRDARVDNVHVSGWKGDAFSFQGGRDTTVTNCSSIGAVEKGFHPGSCQQRIIISRCRAEDCGDDGLFFCRYNQQSVMSNNVLSRNRGAMIGGLARAGDMFNVIVNNCGTDNRGGIPVEGGANNVIVDNILVNSGEGVVMPMAGGAYAGLPHQYHVYAGPTRYHVIVGNIFLDDRALAQPLFAVADRPGAAANLVAANRYRFTAAAAEPFAVTGAGSVARDNQPLQGEAVKACPFPAPPPLPQPEQDASQHYDPAAPDCGFQRAIDECAGRGGGTVRLPAGTYKLRRGLVLPSDVTLCGEGVATVLIWEGPGFAVSSVHARNVAVRRLTVRGSALAQPRGGEDTAGVALIGGRGALIEQVMVEASYDGIITNGEDILISGCKTRGCRVGYDLTRSLRARLVESRALDGTHGLRLGATKDALVHSNVFWHMRGKGILADDAAGSLSIIGNVVSSAGEEGIWFRDALAALVRGNVVHNASLRGKGRFAAVALAGGSTGCRVVANRIGDELFDPFQTTAVGESEGADENEIRYNILCPNNWPQQGTLDEMIVRTGAKSVAADNVLEPYPPPKP